MPCQKSLLVIQSQPYTYIKTAVCQSLPSIETSSHLKAFVNSMLDLMIRSHSLQIDLIGKGGPPSIEEHEVEYDVRLVYVKVLGTPLIDLEVGQGTLRACPHPNAATFKRWTEATVKPSAPRFDSSDSDVDDSSEDPEYLDSFVS